MHLCPQQKLCPCTACCVRNQLNLVFPRNTGVPTFAVPLSVGGATSLTIQNSCPSMPLRVNHPCRCDNARVSQAACSSHIRTTPSQSRTPTERSVCLSSGEIRRLRWLPSPDSHHLSRQHIVLGDVLGLPDAGSVTEAQNVTMHTLSEGVGLTWNAYLESSATKDWNRDRQRVPAR